MQVLNELLDQVDSLTEAIAKITVPTIGTRTWHAVATSRTGSRGNAPTARANTNTFNRSTRSERDHQAELADAVTGKVVEGLVATILHAAIEGSHVTFDDLVLKLRILAVLFCPDPYAHAAVWNHCVLPLLKQNIVVRARTYLPSFLSLFRQPWRWAP